MTPRTFRAEAIVLTHQGERQALTRYLSTFPTKGSLSPYIAEVVDLRVVQWSAASGIPSQKTLRDWTHPHSAKEYVRLMTEHG